MASEYEYHEEQRETYLGETFIQCTPATPVKGSGQEAPACSEDNNDRAPNPSPIGITGINHYAIQARDTEALCRFYMDIFGFERLPRPSLGFPGAWLMISKTDTMLHIINTDPSVPLHYKEDWKDKYSEAPETWMIRRDNHISLEVENFEEAEQRLLEYGCEFSKFVLPEVNLRQIFLYDPEGNGIELGIYDDSRDFLRQHGRQV